jgi:hypothetical protein
MKTILCLVYFVASLSVHADELLQNSDFSDGKNHWDGDGLSPSELQPDNPLASNSSGAAQNELIVQLRPHSWTKVSQRFRTHADRYYILLRFKASPDVKFTNDKDLYLNAAEDLDLWSVRLFHEPDCFLYGITDESKNVWFDGSVDSSFLRAAANPFIRRTVNNIRPEDGKVIYLAFPPGMGNVVIQTISAMTD